MAVLTALVAYLSGEPLRRSVERRMNERLRGYSATIGGLRFNPIGFSLTLHDLVIVQNATANSLAATSIGTYA